MQNPFADASSPRLPAVRRTENWNQYIHRILSGRTGQSRPALRQRSRGQAAAERP